MRIDPLRLLRLHELIKQGSFRKAADSLCITQSALSQSINQMESEVGVRLIDRTSHGVVPTIYGEALMRHATEIDWQLSEAEKKIAGLAFGRQGQLSVGGTSSVISVMSATTRRLREKSGEFEIRLIEEIWNRDLWRQIDDRSLDAVICKEPDDLYMEGMVAVPLFQGRRMLCVRINHPEASDLSLERLAKYPLVSQTGDMSVSREIKRIFSTFHVDFPSSEMIATNSLIAAKDIVLNSDAFAIFTDVSVLGEIQSGSIKCVKMEEDVTTYWYCLIARQDLRITELIANFISVLGVVCQEVGIKVHPGIGRIKAGDTLRR
ncbi:LysR family transcriptional regulator [Paraburkholderia sp. J63]|uniref:LysR family transcriptional regulator n=1 Tax=Paraburkholderia sp. J63 TaxID=2805434 RepID=UPI002ABDB838|nr:LysR family transcriptional regulator [Paraburkholderia sp. J63]